MSLLEVDVALYYNLLDGLAAKFLNAWGYNDIQVLNKGLSMDILWCTLDSQALFIFISLGFLIWVPVLGFDLWK